MTNPLDRLVFSALSGSIPVAIFIVALLAGFLALQITPREEEPQIVVPVVDVMVDAPGLSAVQVDRQVTTPLEKLLAQIPGVEHVYSSSTTGRTSATLRFFVGQDREDSILNTYNKLYSNQDEIPGVVSRWMVRPVEVDDVAIVMLALWSDSPELYNDYELRRMADELSTALQGIPQTSEVQVVGGRPRTIQILFDPEALGARKTTGVDVLNALQQSNALVDAGSWIENNVITVLESGDFIRDVHALEILVVNVVDGVPVYLRDVASIVDGPDEAETYTWIDFTATHPAGPDPDITFPMVTISVAKQRGSNAVSVAEQVHALTAQWAQELLPAQVHVEVLRDYGETANEKVNNLAASLLLAILTVTVFIGVFLGWRQAAVVGLAIPICYGITLTLDMLFGYTINRVTLFALILSLGLLVDDPITGVDNISRFMKRPGGRPGQHIVDAIAEIRMPLLMSTITIVLAFLPLAYISGMMGPYMAPMAFNVPVSVITSTVVAFLVTPWLASRLLKPERQATDAPAPDASAPDLAVATSWLARKYVALVAALLNDRRKAKGMLWFVLLLFIGTAMLPVFRMVPLKLLPFDNKNEVQIVIDLPRGSTLESTAAISQQVSATVRRLPEVLAVAAYVGTPSPIDFNGMVRQYYQRQAPHMADLRVTLVDKTEREHQSHAIVLRLRQLLAPMSRDGVRVKVVEVPPGPPVLSTLVAEVYGETLTPYSTQKDAASVLMKRLSNEAHVVEIDSSIESEQQRARFITDKQKAALSGVSTGDINRMLEIANQGYPGGFLQMQREAQPLPITLRLDPQQRASMSDLLGLQVRGRSGAVKVNTTRGLEAAPEPMVSLGELGGFEQAPADQMILHKDLKPVVYVTAELSGRTPAEVIADVSADQDSQSTTVSDWRNRNYLSSGAGDGWQLPPGTDVVWGGEGEWRITVDVFRDMGIAFAVALIVIFFVLRVQTASTALSLIIMSAIPLTVIGIMPGFWLLNQFGEREVAGAPDPVLFTATAMIGMIALAGIVVRNSLILVEFITQSLQRGLAIKDALLQAGIVRMRPVLLTAGTTLLGNLIITLDPVFSGLALAVIFGIASSTAFTLIVVPVVYLLVFDKPVTAEEK